MFGGSGGRLAALEVLGSGKKWELSMCLFLMLAYWFQDSSQYFMVVELYSQSYKNNAKQIKLGVMSSDWKVLLQVDALVENVHRSLNFFFLGIFFLFDLSFRCYAFIGCLKMNEEICFCYRWFLTETSMVVVLFVHNFYKTLTFWSCFLLLFYFIFLFHFLCFERRET